MKEIIKKLVEAYGPSGHEGQVRALIEGLIRDKADEIRTDALGNLIAFKKGTGGGKRIMTASHMDEIGVIVTYVDKKGFVRCAPIGGVRTMTLVGSRVRFADGTVGVIGAEKWMRSADLPPWEELFVDVGATSADDVPVGVGDAAVFDRPFADLGKRLVSKAMDNRIGCAVNLQALLEMGESPNDVYFVFTTQEEVGLRGATVSAFGVEPDVAIALDVTTVGDTPEAYPMSVSLGDGPTIKVMDSSVIVPAAVKNWMMQTAQKAGIKYQPEVLERGGTDTAAIQRSRAGIPAGCISIPCRYVHSPSEMVDYDDVQGAVRLTVELLTNPVTL